MSNRPGFTLVEAIVAMLIGVILVLAIGRLGQAFIHRRVSTDASSAAASLAERQLEKLLADPNQKPTAAQCAGNPRPALCGATAPGVLVHQIDVDQSGAVSNGGPYRVVWEVTNIANHQQSPLVAPAGFTVIVKKIKITVTHLRDPSVRAEIVNYHRPV